MAKTEHRRAHAPPTCTLCCATLHAPPCHAPFSRTEERSAARIGLPRRMPSVTCVLSAPCFGPLGRHSKTTALLAEWQEVGSRRGCWERRLPLADPWLVGWLVVRACVRARAFVFCVCAVCVVCRVCFLCVFCGTPTSVGSRPGLGSLHLSASP